MFNHAPADYECPFCPLIKGKDHGYNTQEDIAYKNRFVTAFISPKWWINNPGHVIVVSNKHYENIYDIPDAILANVFKAVKKIAKAIRKSYKSDGVSLRQHNEPDGNQDVWHFHVHVFPRYKGDKLYQNHDKKRWITSNGRKKYVTMLRNYFKKNKTKPKQSS